MTENGISILGVKKRGVKRRTLPSVGMFIRKHTVDTGVKRRRVKRRGVKGGGKKAGGKKACYHI